MDIVRRLFGLLILLVGLVVVIGLADCLTIDLWLIVLFIIN